MIFRATLKSMAYKPARLVGTFATFAITLACMLALISLLVATTSNPGPPVLFAGSDLIVRVDRLGEYDEETISSITSIDVRVTDEQLSGIRAIPGVANAEGISLQTAALTNSNGEQFSGEVVQNVAIDSSVMSLSSGSWPTAENEISIHESVATSLNLQPGDSATIAVRGEIQQVTITGLFSGPDSLSEIMVAPGLSTTADGSQFVMIQLDEAADPVQVRDQISQISSDFPLQSFEGKDIAKVDPTSAAADVEEFGALLGVMAGFMGFVSIFVLLSTIGFSIQQRRPQIAIERALGFEPNHIRTAVILEGLIVSVAGSIAGLVLAIPIVEIAASLARSREMVPPPFDPGVDMLVASILIPSMILALILVSWWAARATRKIAPIAAMREARAPSRNVGIWRWVFGIILVGTSLTAIALSAAVPSLLAMMFSLFVIVFVVWGLSLIGPPLVSLFMKLTGPISRFGSPVIGDVAQKNSHRMSARVSSASTPIMLGTGFLIMMFFFNATMEQGTVQVSEGRDGGDIYVVGNASSVPADTADRIGALDGVAVVSPVSELNLVNVPEGEEDIAMELPGIAVDADSFLSTTNLEISSGSLDDWGPGSIIVSDMIVFDTSLSAGKSSEIVMPDGSVRSFHVAAVADNLDGLGDVIYHTSDVESFLEPGDSSRFVVQLEDGADVDAVLATINSLASEGYPVQAVSREDYLASIEQSVSSGAWATYLIIGSSAALGMVASINTLFMSTLERSREFAVMRLVGATHAQVRGIAIREGSLVGLYGVGVGIALALLSAMSVSMAMTGDISAIRAPMLPVILAAIVAFAVCVASMYLPVSMALRKNPMEEAGIKE